MLKLLILAALAAPAHAAPKPAKLAAAETPAQALGAAEDAALRGDYEKARAAAAPLKGRADLSQELKARLYLLEARIADAYEQFPEERAWLQKLKDTAPDAQLDHYRDPPTLFRVWDELKASTPKEAPPPAAPPPAPPVPAPAWTVYAPFGIGHFASDQGVAGGVFLGGDLLALYLSTAGAFERRGSRSGEQNRAQGSAVAAPLLMFGVYGHEVVHLFALRGSPYDGEQLWGKRLLGFFPFGVGQARNGDTTRAVYFASAQAAFLILGGATRDRAARSVGLTAFAFSYGYSVVDAWLRKPKSAAAPTAFQVEPWIPARGAAGARFVVALP